MKKIIALLITAVMALSFIAPMGVSAASASIRLSGPGTVRTGDTITVTLVLNGSGIFGASGTVNYDPGQLTLTATTQSIAAPWAVEFNNGAGSVRFVAYDNNLSSPVNGSKNLLTMKFKVNAGAGTSVGVSTSSVTASDGNADIGVGNASYGFTVAAPLSGNAELASLTVSNAQLSPAFSKSVTEYSTSVPFSVSKLDIKATAEDGGSKVSVNSPDLTPGGVTDASVTVTAQTGAQKVYTIHVTREQDPNYVPSDNNLLSGIALDVGILSPVFDQNQTEYVVWLPYEVEKIAVGGTAADPKATVTVSGGDALIAGEDNPVTVTCAAENKTEKKYTVVVKRAAAHDASDASSQLTGAEGTGGVPLWLTGILCLLFAGGGLGGGYFLFDKRSGKATPPEA